MTNGITRMATQENKRQSDHAQIKPSPRLGLVRAWEMRKEMIKEEDSQNKKGIPRIPLKRKRMEDSQEDIRKDGEVVQTNSNTVWTTEKRFCGLDNSLLLECKQREQRSFGHLVENMETSLGGKMKNSSTAHNL